MKIFILAILVSITVIACSTETRQLFFDIQPPTAEELAAQSRKEKAAQRNGMDKKGLMGIGMLFPELNDDSPPPEIEKIKEWEKVEEMLPKDEEDNVDWSAALEQGLIRPRVGDDLRTLLMSTFQWDFIIRYVEDEEDSETDDDEEEEGSETEDDEEDEVVEGAPREEDAYFPHSAHTEWLSCRNCHMSIYPYRRNPATMKEMKKGASCGICHGKNTKKTIAFTLKACDRCHLYSEDDDEEEKDEG